MLPHQRPWVVLKRACDRDRGIVPKRSRAIVGSSSTQATGWPAEPASLFKALNALMQGGLSETEARAFLISGKKLPTG